MVLGGAAVAAGAAAAINIIVVIGGRARSGGYVNVGHDASAVCRGRGDRGCRAHCAIAFRPSDLGNTASTGGGGGVVVGVVVVVVAAATVDNASSCSSGTEAGGAFAAAARHELDLNGTAGNTPIAAAARVALRSSIVAEEETEHVAATVTVAVADSIVVVI